MGVLMTITTSEVQDIQTTIRTDLEAGTWTNYGSQPKVYDEKRTKFGNNVYISIYNTSGNVVQAINGAVIMFEDQCVVEINSPNRTDLNKIYTDVLNILNATTRGYVYRRTQDVPKKTRYRKLITIQLKDI